MERSLRELTGAIVDTGLKVHRTLGPGLLESAYEHCLSHELSSSGIPCRRQVALPIHYDGLTLDEGYRLDLVVENAVIIEIKAVDSLGRIHQAQLMTYMKLSGMRIGFLMNFNVILFKDGMKRFVL